MATRTPREVFRNVEKWQRRRPRSLGGSHGVPGREAGSLLWELASVTREAMSARSEVSGLDKAGDIVVQEKWSLLFLFTLSNSSSRF